MTRAVEDEREREIRRGAEERNGRVCAGLSFGGGAAV